MGQYYLVVNIDKKQYLNPVDFNDGMKLAEFGHSTEGTLLALTLLLADGNGRGGGDFFCSQYLREQERYQQKKAKTLPNARKLNDPIIGSWAGDRIVIAGGYADSREFLTGEEVQRYQKWHEDHEGPERREYKEKNTTLFEVAYRFYTNISQQVLEVLTDCGAISPETQKEIKEWNRKRKKFRLI
jgi:hypothetical protein